MAIDTFSAIDVKTKPLETPATLPAPAAAAPAPVKMSLGGLMGRGNSNPLMGGTKKNALASKKQNIVPMDPKMSNAECIIKEEMEQKRLRDERGGGGKRQRMA